MRLCMGVMASLLVFLICSGVVSADRHEVFIEVPFELQHNEILVQVQINGRGPFTVLLDTDTDPCSVDLSFAKSQNLKLREVHGAVHGGGSDRPQVYLTELRDTQLGRLPARNLQAFAIDLSRVRERLGRDIQGVLGRNFLSRQVVQIDYPKQVLRFYRSSFLSSDASNGRLIFPFKVDEDGSIVMAGVTVNGRPVAATIDTGSDGTFKLTPAAVEQLGLTDTALKGESEVSLGYKGEAQNTVGKVELISLGSVVIHSPEVVFLGKGSGRDREPWGVNIGNAFLKDYVLTIDYRAKLIALEKP